jgi:glycosyltransferase involved in cell wall biosynthesis
MRIGIDITGLYIARAGIYTYSLNLLQQMLALESGHEFVLLDYMPARGRRTLPFDLPALVAGRAEVALIAGPYQRKLSDWPRLNFFGGRFAAQCVDALLEEPWRWLGAGLTRAELNRHLARLDLLHLSDVAQFGPGRAGLVSTVYDLSPLLFPRWHTPQNRAIFQRKIAHIRRHRPTIIAISEHTRRDLIEALAIPPAQIQVVPCAADARYRPLDDLSEIRRVTGKYGLPKTGYLLYVGTLEPRKNLVRLLEAYALAQGGGDLPPLVVAGAKGWFYEEIFHTATWLKLEQRVIFTGFVAEEDLPALYNGALLFVYPSLYEGFGLPVLEAMACGVPVITSNVSSLPEVAGEAGVLISPTDTEALAAAIRSLLDDSGRRAGLRAAGLARAASFSWERAARETLAVYERIGRE